VKSINVSWSQAKNHFTSSFETYAIALLQATFNQTKVTEILRISSILIHISQYRKNIGIAG